MQPSEQELQRLRKVQQLLIRTLLQAGSEGDVLAMKRTESLKEAVERAGRQVHAVGIGLKVSGGIEKKDQWCVQVYLVQKIQEKDQLMKAGVLIPNEIDGVPIDVIESPPAFLLPVDSLSRAEHSLSPPSLLLPAATVGGSSCSINRKSIRRPVCAGISTGRLGGRTGTIAAFCRTRGAAENEVLVLSNRHIFGAGPGQLVQPGPLDSGAAHFANFERAAPFTPGSTVFNKVDAAVGRLISGVGSIREVCSLGVVTATARATVGRKVRFHGRTSGRSEGTVRSVTYTSLVGLDPANTANKALFADQIRIDKPTGVFAADGDSGSLIVRKNAPQAVGLLFAARPADLTNPHSIAYGVANHIDEVLSALNVKLI